MGFSDEGYPIQIFIATEPQIMGVIGGQTDSGMVYDQQAAAIFSHPTTKDQPATLAIVATAVAIFVVTSIICGRLFLKACAVCFNISLMP